MSWATFGTVTKDVGSALRDLVVFGLFLLLLVFPGCVHDRLVLAGFTKGNIGGLEWEAKMRNAAEQTKTVGETVDRASESYEKLVERLSELEKSIQNPSDKATVRELGNVAEQSRADLTRADRAVKQSLAIQQQIVQSINPAAVVDSGWMFLGKVTEDKKMWWPDYRQTVLATDTPPVAGTRLTVRDDAYLRADGPANARTSTPVLGVAKVGDTVQVIDIDYSHAKGGGWFVWARVRRV